MILVLLAVLTLQSPADSAHVRAQRVRLDSSSLALDSLRRWCRVAGYTSPKYLRKVCPIALASPDKRARRSEDSLLIPAPPPPPPVDTQPTPPPPPPPPSSGVAELPRSVPTFPYPTPTRTVVVTSNLQTALNNAQRGDELVLSGNFSGNFTISSCGPGWITLRGAGTYPPFNFPAIGTRLTPSSVPGLAQLSTPNTGPVITYTGCRWRFVGMDWTVASSVTAVQFGIVDLRGSEIALDRMYIHGQPTTNTTRCVALNSAATAITDSYLDHCHAKGYDAQAIGGWNGPGPFLIENNYLAGSGENIMFGGADPSVAGLVPSDITIRRNYIHTPIAWRTGYPTTLWTKKNLLEFKNAQRVLIEANVFDGSWTDGQTGWALVMWSVNQSGNCRWCRTTDVTVRRNLIKNAGAGINLGARWLNTDTIPSRFLITENVLDSIAVGVYGTNADRRGFQMSPSKDVELSRNVLSGSLSAALVFDLLSTGCVFRDNVWASGSYGVLTSGVGAGTASIVKTCGTSYVWSGMALIGSSGGNVYPPGTTWLGAESQSALAAQIRSIVSQATAGVVIIP